MAVISAYDDIINQIGGSFTRTQPIYELISAAGVALGGNGAAMIRCGQTTAFPSLPTEVTAFIPTAWSIHATGSTPSSFALVNMVNLGSLNIATPTFTDGSAMPTVTELGTSRVTSGAVWCEVTTVLNSLPGSITITYTDQDGNTAETTTAQALGASAPVKSSGFIALNSPDNGVRDITAATRTGGTTPTGVVQFWGIIPLGFIAHGGVNDIGGFQNLLTSGFNCQRLGAADTLGVFAFQGFAKSVVGSIFIVGDS